MRKAKSKNYFFGMANLHFIIKRIGLPPMANYLILPYIGGFYYLSMFFKVLCLAYCDYFAQLRDENSLGWG